MGSLRLLPSLLGNVDCACNDFLISKDVKRLDNLLSGNKASAFARAKGEGIV